MTDEQLRAQETELNRATLPAIVLAILRTKEYGLGLIKRLQQAGISADSNTVYPLLRRLEQQGYVSCEWDVSADNRPKKYYRTTDEGEAYLTASFQQWMARAQLMDQLFKEV